MSSRGTQSSGGSTYLTVPAAADLLGASRWSVTRWCRAGLISGARKPGGRWQIPETSVQALLTPIAVRA